MPDLNIPSGGIYGQQKWLPGSLGTDIFLPQGSAITAGAGGRILEEMGGTGLQGGAELIFQAASGLTYRLRHIASTLQPGQTVSPGQTLGIVSDASLNLLGAIPLPTPSGWQHLDLSVNQGSTQFSPQGGGGGNVSAFRWLQSIGYQGRVVPQTPGPNNANGVGFTGGNPPSFLSQLGGLMGQPGEPSVPPGWGPFTGGEGAPGGGYGGGAGGAANLLPDPGAIVGEAGSAVVGAAGKALTDFWQRSGATIGVLLLGVGAVAIALLRTETVQTALAGSAKAAAL